MPGVDLGVVVPRLLFQQQGCDEITTAIAAGGPDGATWSPWQRDRRGPGADFAELASSPGPHGHEHQSQIVTRPRRRAVRTMSALTAAALIDSGAAPPLPRRLIDLLVSSYAVRRLPDRRAARARDPAGARAQQPGDHLGHHVAARRFRLGGRRPPTTPRRSSRPARRGNAGRHAGCCSGSEPALPGDVAGFRRPDAPEVPTALSTGWTGLQWRVCQARRARAWQSRASSGWSVDESSSSPPM